MFSVVYNSSRQFLKWLFVDHPNQWENGLPACLAPTPPIPILPYEGNEGEYSATREETDKLQEIFNHSIPRGVHRNLLPNKVVKGLGWGGSAQRQIPGGIEWSAGHSTGDDRAVMAKRMRLAIEKLGLNHLYVPEKRVAVLNMRFGEERVAVVEKLDLMSHKETEEYMEELLDTSRLDEIMSQFYTLLRETGASDLENLGKNFGFIRSGEHQKKLAIIDTESWGLLDVHSRYEKWEPGIEEHNYTIWFLGGPRYLDLVTGGSADPNLIFEPVLWFNGNARKWKKTYKTASHYLKGTCRTCCEIATNFMKKWTLRLLLPATVASAYYVQRMNEMGSFQKWMI